MWRSKLIILILHYNDGMMGQFWEEKKLTWTIWVMLYCGTSLPCSLLQVNSVLQKQWAALSTQNLLINDPPHLYEG